MTCLWKTLPLLAHGSYEAEKVVEVGESVAFQCDGGYYPTSVRGLTCEGDGSWKGEAMCLPVSCGDPGEFENAKLLDHVFNFPRGVRYQCTTNYYLASPRTTFYCGANGVWTPPPYVKCVKCQDFSAPRNGSVSYDEDGATFQCHQGFQLVGLSHRKCLSSGEWDEASLPTCQEMECDVVPFPNGTVNAIGKLFTFKCDAGYKLEGKQVLKCEKGQLIGDLPTCKRLCPDLPPLKHGSIHYHGQEAIYRCNKGYQLDGEAKRTCQASQKVWTGVAPTCIPVKKEKKNVWWTFLVLFIVKLAYIIRIIWNAYKKKIP